MAKKGGVTTEMLSLLQAFWLGRHRGLLERQTSASWFFLGFG